MSKARVPLAIATLFALQSLLAFTSAAAQEAMEKKSYNYSAWTPGIFSEAVTITNMGKGKFIFLAGVGAEDENGPRGRSATPAISGRSAPTPTTRSSGRSRPTARA